MNKQIDKMKKKLRRRGKKYRKIKNSMNVLLSLFLLFFSFATNLSSNCDAHKRTSDVMRYDTKKRTRINTANGFVKKKKNKFKFISKPEKKENKTQKLRIPMTRSTNALHNTKKNIPIHQNLFELAKKIFYLRFGFGFECRK